VLLAVLLAVLLPGLALADQPLKALRVWPSPDYTRMTLESHDAIEYEIAVIPEPGRVVLDLQNVDCDSLRALLARYSFERDPNIRGVRVGRFKPGVTRMVLDLRADVRPQIFALKPVDQYENRLVLDVYPLTPPDPLAQLIRQQIEPSPGTATAQNTTATAPAAKGNPWDIGPPAPNGKPGAGAGSAADAQSAEAKALAEAKSILLGKSSAETKRLPVPPASGGARPPSSAEAATGLRRLPRTVIVVVDAGHGGEDPGARGHRGTYEKDVTLAIAKKLKTEIDAQPQMRAILTRDSDYFIPLAGRVEKARRAHADLFVSVHADSFVRSDARGSSVFALSERGATSEAASWLARDENRADLIGGVNLNIRDRPVARTLLDLSQTAAISDSMTLGKQVLTELGGVNRLHKGFVEQAGFAVLKSPDVPSILVETAFISNPDEENRLRDPAYQQRIARAIVAGLTRYFARNPPLARQNIVASSTLTPGAGAHAGSDTRPGQATPR